MKRLSILVFSALLCASAFTSRAFDLVVSNNAIIGGFGDSLDVDDSAPSTGYLRQAYIHSYFALNYPQFTLEFYDNGRSGGDMDDRLTNSLQSFGLGIFGYQSNNLQRIGISFGTDNSNLTSNQMYLAQSNICRAPALMSDGAFPLTTQTGWAATHPIQWIVAGSPPAANVAGGDDGGAQSQRARDAACTNAGRDFGVIGVSLFVNEVAVVTNDAAQNSGNTIGIFNGNSKFGHAEAPWDLLMAVDFLKQVTTDTNISTGVVDWNSATVVDTNHCVISSVSRNGNTLTFNRLDDRLPMAYDISSTDPTNNATPIFGIAPWLASAFRFAQQITNLPAGSYDVLIDGVLSGHNVPSTVLGSANGWNMFTNTVGPYWEQRTEVLRRIRILEHVDTVTRIPGSAGDDQGEVSLGATAFSKWTSGYRGDALIAQMNSKVAQLQTNFTAIHAAAQPTNHSFTITLAVPRFAPFHK